MQISKFPAGIHEQLGYYVYVYVDVSDDEEKILYIGKGKGNRCFAHLDKIDDTDKSNEINNLHASGLLRIDILIYGVDETTALKVEAAAIDLFRLDRLYNQKRGDDSRQHGRISTNDLVARLQPRCYLTEQDFHDNCILIRVNKRYFSGISSQELYDSTRGVWVVGEKSVEKVKFALAVYEGVVREVYLVAGWYKEGSTMYSTRDDLNSANERDTRMEFVGRIADESDREKYIYADVSSVFKYGAQNPIAYFGPDF